MYGLEYAPIAADQVTTPSVNVNTFIDPETLCLYGKFPDGSVKLLSGAGAGTSLAAQAANTGTANAMVVTIDGVETYTTGDIYYILSPSANTGAVTLNINALGVKNVKYKGTILADLPSGKLAAYSVNAFIYDGTQFQYIGTVDGNFVKLSMPVGYTEAAALSAGTDTAAMNLIYTPPTATLIAASLYPTVAVTGGAISAATVAFINKESALNVFGGTVNTFSAVAADKGAISNGLKSNSDLPFQAGTQIWEAQWVLTGGDWTDAATGSFQLEFVWMPL